MTIIHVAVGLIFSPQGMILIAQRPPGKYQSGLWEFPGGKVEANETILQALQRELWEEVGIQVISAQPWLQVKHDYVDREVLLDIWQVNQFSGEPHGREGQQVQWSTLACLQHFQFPAGNRKILEKLQSA